MISAVARKRATLDFIVVGAGAAGCVVAARLAAAHGSASVVLLEAGPDLRSKVPPEFREDWTIDPELFDWALTAEPVIIMTCGRYDERRLSAAHPG
jgi:choline dehydrogenase-like flavoprotein